MPVELPVGLLFSCTGPYGTVVRSMVGGALLACREINEIADAQVHITPILRDPGGNLNAYARHTQDLIGLGVRHICGCYTSSSRKEVIPLIDKADALLWYPTHYEGFESATNVIYTGASPNHHLSPLIGFMFRRYGRRAYSVGSNYIWGWESNRVFREGVLRRGGEIMGERYVPVGETDLDAIVEEILALRPDFVFNSLIGSSSYAFFRKLRSRCLALGIDQPRQMPVASCNLSEPELEAIGPDAADGQISSSVYFSSLESAQNKAFLARYRLAFPDGAAMSAEGEASYIAIHLLARAVAAAGTTRMEAVREAVLGMSIDAPQGKVTIDPQTLHASLTTRIGLSRSDYTFDVLDESEGPVAPDPYLVRIPGETEMSRRPDFRIVS